MMAGQQFSPTRLIGKQELVLPLIHNIYYQSVLCRRRENNIIHNEILPLNAAPPFACTDDPFIRLGLSTDRPLIMAIINMTPDSFSDGGKYLGRGRDYAYKLLEAGADILDIGGESTRPGADIVSVAEEIDRIGRLVEEMAKAGAIISVDTRKSEVMREALRLGAAIINDVSTLSYDSAAAEYLSTTDCVVIMTHAQGTPDIMQEAPFYHDVCFEVVESLSASLDYATRAGIARSRIVVDPGIGFGKSYGHNIELLRGLAQLHALRRPIMLGVSRKSFIAKAGRDTIAANRIGGSLAAGLIGLDNGVRILRVHDVAETVQAVNIWQAIKYG